ncbi:30S ribosomal protein S9 [Candidatus Curtissbacteria bacterium RIFCSPHIGHO2_01_FULL_41_11]|uniref:Small ribosomal subunit protein uS9 n=1 Tax=Candidatus Curtissbacteria bacterium RIFCSPHIGHO2_01_FULL_41_11 TaxID=1797711 RepID=A0A1F5G3M1_9BACT|nr:MAG: 30S ribosomal protein S9 [Candidatus Curtissbacteria bacterium RIFCSPHIGHO2_01_FULL_41_11]
MADQEESTKKQATDKKPKKDYVSSHGRRKEATARVRLFKGKGDLTVNSKPAEKYFPGPTSKVKLQKPFVLTKTQESYYATINISGSGKNSQLEAAIHGIAHALTEADPAFRPALKKAGLLTRDPRVKERRKYGRAQKARKGKQSPKR